MLWAPRSANQAGRWVNGDSIDRSGRSLNACRWDESGIALRMTLSWTAGLMVDERDDAANRARSID
jgi:hypothetical protein